jgi:hypothetical protein
LAIRPDAVEHLQAKPQYLNLAGALAAGCVTPRHGIHTNLFEGTFYFPVKTKQLLLRKAGFLQVFDVLLKIGVGGRMDAEFGTIDGPHFPTSKPPNCSLDKLGPTCR